MRNKFVTTAALIGAGAVLFTGGLHTLHAGRADHEKYLFVWAGDQARVNPDFLSVIGFDEHSRDYGSVIATLPLPGPGATGNEPHHVGLSADGRVLAAGGLLSVLKGRKRTSSSMLAIPGSRSSSPPPTRRFQRSQTISMLSLMAGSWSR
jgi:hypothetical protein